MEDEELITDMGTDFGDVENEEEICGERKILNPGIRCSHNSMSTGVIQLSRNSPATRVATWYYGQSFENVNFKPGELHSTINRLSAKPIAAHDWQQCWMVIILQCEY